MGKGNHGQKRIQMHQKMDVYPNKGQQQQLTTKAMLAMKRHSHRWVYALLLVLGLSSMVYFVSGSDYPTGSIVLDQSSQKYAWPELKEKENSCSANVQVLQEQVSALQTDINDLKTLIEQRNS